MSHTARQNLQEAALQITAANSEEGTNNNGQYKTDLASVFVSELCCTVYTTLIQCHCGSHTSNDALKRYVKQSVLCLSIRRLHGTSSWSEEDVDDCVITGQRSDIVVSNTPVHTTTGRLHVIQRQVLALHTPAQRFKHRSQQCQWHLTAVHRRGCHKSCGFYRRCQLTKLCVTCVYHKHQTYTLTTSISHISKVCLCFMTFIIVSISYTCWP